MLFSVDERLFLVKLCIKSEENGKIRMEWVRERFAHEVEKQAPSLGCIRKLVKNHNQTGSVQNGHKGIPRWRIGEWSEIAFRLAFGPRTITK